MTVNLDELDPSEWKSDAISFRGQTAGELEIASAYHSAGTHEGWIEAITPIKDYPRVRILLYASFVPAIQMIVNAPNFTVETFSRTSIGKTIALKVAASPWGTPDERSKDGAMKAWDVTRVFLERASAIISRMPLILDDTKRA